jgi:release factor glutamine methyltransferase
MYCCRRFSTKAFKQDFKLMESVLKRGERLLIGQGIDAPTARRDAQTLLAHCAGLPSRNELLVDASTRYLHDANVLQQFERSLRRRSMREPLQYIVGRAEFYGREFELWPGETLIPRSDTELLVDVALELVRQDADYASSLLLVDVGTGTGCILCSLLLELPEHVRGLGLDISANALVVATRNSLRHGLFGRARFLTSDWLSNVPQSLSRNQSTLIVCNRKPLCSYVASPALNN